MIVALMIYSMVVTLLLAAGALAAERLLHLSRRPSRFVWAAAMVAAVGLSAARIPAAFSPAASADAMILRGIADASVTVAPAAPATVTNAPPTQIDVNGRIARPRLTAPAVQIRAGSLTARIERPVTIAWMIATIAFLCAILLSALRLARAGRRWPAAAVDGVPVRVSHDLGPAVVGILRYSIVLPQWALDLPADERAMILAHEREHARAGDPSILFGATLLVALMPWNAALWWMGRRLRYAIELDCDARVLRNRDARAYGALLLDVSERTMGGAMPVAAMAEPVSLIERRIAAMTARLPRFAPLRAILSGVATIALVIVACSTPHPTPAPEPTPEVKQPPRETVSRDTVRSGEIRTTVEKAAPRTPPRVDTADYKYWASQDSVLRRWLAEQQQLPSATALANDSALYRRLLALLDSVRALRPSQGRLDGPASGRAANGGGYGTGIAPSESRRYAGTAGGGSGAISGRLSGNRYSYGGGDLPWPERGKVMIGLANDSGPRVTIGALGEIGSLRRTGAPAPQAMVGGVYVGTEYTVTRSRQIIEVARAAAERFFPSAFQPHEGQFEMVTIVFDTSGAVVKTGRATRAPLGTDESVRDRDQLQATLPGVNIESFSEWGMANLTSAQQSRASGVMLLYAFRK